MCNMCVCLYVCVRVCVCVCVYSIKYLLARHWAKPTVVRFLSGMKMGLFRRKIGLFCHTSDRSEEIFYLWILYFSNPYTTRYALAYRGQRSRHHHQAQESLGACSNTFRTFYSCSPCSFPCCILWQCVIFWMLSFLICLFSCCILSECVMSMFAFLCVRVCVCARACPSTHAHFRTHKHTCVHACVHECTICIVA